MSKSELAFVKLAKIYGAQTPNIGHVALSVDDVLPGYIEHQRKKAQETKTGWGTALGTGGGIGALLGGLLGASAGHGSTGMGALLGGGLGMLFASLAKAVDDGNIEEAKNIVAASNVDAAAKSSLIRMLGDSQAARDAMMRQQTTNSTITALNSFDR